MVGQGPEAKMTGNGNLSGHAVRAENTLRAENAVRAGHVARAGFVARVGCAVSMMHRNRGCGCHARSEVRAKDALGKRTNPTGYQVGHVAVPFCPATATNS